MGNPIQEARAAGYSDHEINAFLSPRMADAMEAGYSQDEVNRYLGVQAPPDYDFSRLRGHIEAELAARQGGPQAVTDLEGALDAGLQLSVTGLLARGKAPDKYLGQGAPWYARAAHTAGQIVGDVPAMVAGFLMAAPEGAEGGAAVGGVGGAAVGSVVPGPGTAAGAAVGAAGGGLIGGTAMGFGGAAALPTVLRETLMDAYTKGNFTNFRDFWGRASGIFLDTAKSYITGAATGAAGKYVEGVAPAALSPTIRAATTTAAEIGTMTTVGDALEGRVPTAQEFLDAGLVLGGLKASGMVAGRLRSVYAKTGVPPSAVLSDAQKDVTISQDLLSDSREVPRAYTAPGAFEDGQMRPASDIPAFAEQHAIGKERGAPIPDVTFQLGQAQHVVDKLAGFNPAFADLPPDFFASGRSLKHAEEQRPGTLAEHGGALPDLLSNAQMVLPNPTAADPWARPWVVTRDGKGTALIAEVRPDGQGTDVVNIITPLENSRVNKALRRAADLGYSEDDLKIAGLGGRTAPPSSLGEADPTLTRPATLSDVQPGPNNVEPPAEAGKGGPPAEPPAGEPPATPGEAPKGPTDAEFSEVKPSLDEAQRRVLGHIDIGGADPTRKLTWSRLYTNMLDRFFPIWQAVKAAGGGDLEASDHAGKLAQLYSGVWGKADHMLNYGTFDFNTYETNGKGLQKVLAPVKDDLDGFRAFAASARALELERRGVKTGFDMAAARVVAEHGMDKYMPVLNEMLGYQDRVAAYLRDSGVLSQKGFEAMQEANKLYVPFYRVMGEQPSGPGTGGKTLQPVNPLKRIKGSEREIIDPLESIVRNTYLYTQMAERNSVVGALVDLLHAGGKDSPAGRELVPMAPKDVVTRGDQDFTGYLHDLGVEAPDELGTVLRAAAETDPRDQISMFRDGRRESYKVDIALARAVKGLDNESMNTLVRVLAAPASMLRAGATLTPDFALRHTIRDFMYAVITHPGAFNPLDMARGFAGLVTKDADYREWLKSGGAQVSLVSLDREYLQENLDKLTRDTGLMDRAWNVVGTPSRWLPTMLHPLHLLTEWAESASHLGAFKKAMRAGEADAPSGEAAGVGGLPATTDTVNLPVDARAMPPGATDAEFREVGPSDYKRMVQEAGWSSRSTAVDVARRGASMQAWNLISAFANVTLQDTDRIVRAFKDAPLSTTMKVAGGIVLPSALLWWANHDDPRWEEIPRWEKDMFWIVMTPNHIFRIPKPFGAGILFGSGTERLLEKFAADNPDAFKRWGQSLIETLTPRMLPTAAAPIIDQFANRSTFTNQTLVPSSAEKLLPEYQYTPYTSETAKALGSMLGAFPGIRDWKTERDDPMAGGVARALSSPILLENYISAWTGTLGRYALKIADAGLRRAGVVPDPPKPADTLSDIPVIRAFTVRYPSGAAQSIQDFYDALEHNKVFYDTWMDRAKHGDTAATQSVQESGGPLMFARLDQMKAVLGEQSQFIRNIWANPDIPPDEKRQLIDTTYYRMIEIAHAGNGMLHQMGAELPTRH